MSVEGSSFCQAYEDAYDTALSNHGFDPEDFKLQVSDKVAIGLLAITIFASFIIGCLALSGTLPLSTAGWCVLGLGGAGFAATFISETARKNLLIATICALVAASLPMIIGGITGAGMLTATQFGWIMIGPLVAGVGLGVLMGCCGGCCIGCALSLGGLGNPK